eukprot:gene4797-9566_t
MKRKRGQIKIPEFDMRDYLQRSTCPVCNDVFPSKIIESHVSSHFEPKAEYDIKHASVVKNPPCDTTIPSNNVFNIMMKAATNRSRVMSFRLTFVEGTILPEIFFSEDEIENHNHHPRFDIKWKSDVKIVNFPCTIIDDSTENIRISITTNISSDDIIKNDGSCSQSQEHQSSPIISIAVLKSMLQKATRRRRSSAVARLSAELCRLDVSEFLRRIPIIIVEDGILHPGLPVIVWLMMAVSKGYRPPTFLIAICIKILVEVASSEIRDFIPMDDYISEHNNNNNSHTSSSTSITTTSSITSNTQPMSSSIRELPFGPHRTLILSLLLRACYGGMKGDTILLINTARVWYRRFVETKDAICTDGKLQIQRDSLVALQSFTDKVNGYTTCYMHYLTALQHQHQQG